MKPRHFFRACVVVGALIAASLFFVGGAALRLAMGPISLGPFAGAIEDVLNRSITGLVVRFDQAVLEWSREDGNINLAILGTKVFDVNGRIIAQAPKADLDFDGVALLGGKLALKRFALLGMQVTAVRGTDNTLKLGFGPIQGDADILKIIRDTLSKRGGDGAGTLETFSISDARLAFRDDITGAFVVAPNLTFEVRNRDGALTATLEAAVEISGAPAVIAAKATLRDNGGADSGTIAIRGLDLAALAANSPKFAALSDYKLKSDLSGSFALGDDGELTSAGFTVESSGQMSPPGLGMPLRVERLALVGRYDGTDKRLTLDNISLAGPDISGEGTGDFRFLWQDDALRVASSGLKLKNVRIVAPEHFSAPLQLTNFGVEAIYNVPAKRITWVNIALAGGGLTGKFSGTTVLSEGQSPAITLNGEVQKINVADLIKFWPTNIGPGARLWIVDNVAQGTMGPFAITADVPAGALFIGEPLPDDAVNVTFPIENMTATYIRGLTPLTNGKGAAQLTGGSFRAQMSEGNVGPIAVRAGTVDIPTLHIRHSPGEFKVHGDGRVEDVLRLIDMPPLGYARRFRIDPAQTEGTAALDLDFSIPMKRDLKVDEIKIAVAAKVNGFALPLGERRKLDRGIASLTVDNARLTAEGAARMSGVPLAFNWTEEFVPVGTDLTTKIDIQARLNDASRVTLGLIEPSWVRGTIPVTATLRGRRFDFREADVRADLTGASAEIEAINVVKKAGEPAMGSGNVRFGEGGAFTVTDLDVTGENLHIRGGLSFGPRGALLSATMSEIKAGPNNDFALNMEAPADGSRIWHLRGRAVDATRVFGEQDEDKAGRAVAPPTAPTRGNERPITIRATLDRTVLRENLSLRAVDFAIELGPERRINGFSLDAEGPTPTGRVVGRFTEKAGARQMTIHADAAGDFINGMTGFPSMLGGKVAVRVDFPVPGSGVGGDYSGLVELNDFTVVDQPFLARLFSIGTLDGPLRLLQGQGIQINRLDAPFTANGPLLLFRNGRAAGPALGFSFQGTVDREKDTLNLNGSMAPVYGINSMLGSLPLVGNLLTSKEGEGIFGITYQVRGNIDEPNVAMNPLSMLTPGIFRRIFEFGGPPTQPTAQNAIPGAVPNPPASAN